MAVVSIPGHDGLVRFEVSGWAYPQARHAFDRDWLRCEITIEVPGFVARVPSTMLLEDFRAIRSGIASLLDHLGEEASWEFNQSYEGQIDLHFRLGKLGSLTVAGEAKDGVGLGNRLTFAFESDQSFLAGSLAELDSLISDFPLCAKIDVGAGAGENVCIHSEEGGKGETEGCPLPGSGGQARQGAVSDGCTG